VSSNVTVKAFVADELCAALMAVDVNTSFDAAAAVMVSCCVADVRPVAEAVMVGVPALVSP
jgi:hypothetical protein